jgi:hypothetical protein
MKKNLITRKEELKRKKSMIGISSFLLAIATFLVLSTSANSFNSEKNPDQLALQCNDLENEECKIALNSYFELEEPIKIEDVYVYEIEEEVNIGFDTKQYLPEGFNPLEGIHALDWSSIELIEPEYEMDIDYITNQFSLKAYKPLKTIIILDWDKIVLNKIEKNLNIKLNTNKLFTKDLNTLKGLDILNWDTIISIELRKNINIDCKEKKYIQ